MGKVDHNLLLKLSRADGFMTNGLAPSQNITWLIHESFGLFIYALVVVHHY